MTYEQIFSLAGTTAMAGWAGLIFVPRYARLVSRFVIPGLLAALYVWLVSTSLPGADGGFGSLAEVRKLFAGDGALLAGWVHYLAFDLFTGAWEVEDARARGVSHWLVIPCLVLTFLLGPAGLLLYLGIRQTSRVTSPLSNGTGSASSTRTET